MKVVYASSIDSRRPALAPSAPLHRLWPGEGGEVKVLCLDEVVGRLFRRSAWSAAVTPLTSQDSTCAAQRQSGRHLGGADVVHTQDRRAGLLVRPGARTRAAASVHTFHGLPDHLAWTSSCGRAGPRRPSGRGGCDGHHPAEALLSRWGRSSLRRTRSAESSPARGARRADPRGPVRRRACGARSPARRAILRSSSPRRCSSYHKGIDMLLDACAQARGSIGSRSTATARCARSWRRRPPGSASRRFQARRRRADELRDVDVFVLPTRGDNLPIAILEAMACAVPVVATRVGGVPELVDDGETGILVEPGDAGGSRGALDEAVVDPALRVSFGRAGARRRRARFDRATMAVRW